MYVDILVYWTMMSCLVAWRKDCSCVLPEVCHLLQPMRLFLWPAHITTAQHKACLATISVLQVFFACTVNNILSHHEYTSINNSFCTGLIVCVFTDTTTWTVILFERKTVEKALFLTVRGRTCLRFERLRMVLSFFKVSRCWDTYTSSNVWIKQWNCT